MALDYQPRPVQQGQSTLRGLRPLVQFAGVLLLLMLLGALIISNFVVAMDVDLESGRLRHQVFLFGISITNRIEETDVSRYAATAPSVPNWSTVKRHTGFANYGPSYVGARNFRDVRTLEALWADRTFSPDAQRRSAEMLLTRWRAGDSDATREWLQRLSDQTRTVPAGRQVEPADLPP